MPSTSELIVYAKTVHRNVRAAGLKVNVGTASAPVVVDVGSDTDAKADIGGMVQMIGLAAVARQPVTSFDWDNADGSVLTLSADQVKALALALSIYLQAVRDARRAVIAEIKAGTIKTRTDVANPALWPSSVVTAPSAS